MELRGRYAGYPMAWLLATSAWHHHGLDKDPTSPNAWSSLCRLVFEGLQQECSAVSAGYPDEQGSGPGLAWLQALVGLDQMQQLCGDQKQLGLDSSELRDRDLTDGEPCLLEHLIVDARAFAVCLSA
uniref:Uncharacterized protein n=2 Tax=Dunaliella tertiolecta TaxID=3047 RepID=A0A7S3R8B7_DUNTE